MLNLLQCIGYYIVEKNIKPEYIDIPCKEILSVSSCICNIYPNLNACLGEGIEGKNIGCDILGADNGSFHSYLCNGLEKDIKKKYEVVFTENGLIANEYKEVEKMAKHIKGLGEPVNWLPYILYDYT